MEDEVLIEIRISKLHCRRQSTCRILSAIFMEKDTAQIDAEFCENNAAWM